MNPLEERVKVLEDRLNMLEKSDRYTFEKKIQILDGRNIQVGTRTGTIIATDPTQKLGFFAKTPVTQRTSVPVTDAGIHAALVQLGLITV